MLSRLYKPKPVSTGSVILSLALVAGLAMVVLERTYYHSGLLDAFTLPLEIVVYGALALLIVLISSGQGWARFVLGALLLAGLVLGVPVILKALPVNAVLGGLGIAQIALVVLALLLLFGGRANAWYRG
jgi:hypothetical protein